MEFGGVTLNPATMEGGGATLGGPKGSKTAFGGLPNVPRQVSDILFCNISWICY